jgi:hypothetical protein
VHFEILVEDISGKELLEIIVRKMIAGTPSTCSIHSYKGCGRIPGDLRTRQDASKRILLEQLPRLLRGFGKTFAGSGYTAAVIVVLDCDNRNCLDFKKELVSVLDACNPKPVTFFRIAIEGMEAWLLGDEAALQKAYPGYDKAAYHTYKQGSIIGTWEKLADIVLLKDSEKLKKTTVFETGRKKTEWAKNIGKYMDIHKNNSKSFNCFKKKIEELSGSIPCPP